MNTIGHFRRDGDGFAGRLTTLTLDADLRLTPSEKFSSKAPDYVALIGDKECGAAWRVADASGALLNLKLDDPSWPEPINARLMAAEDGVLPLTWMRKVEPPTQPAAPPPGPG
ncbi:DUF736 domain-containing protein [Caulobacter sp. SSI4214]|uniref:DUF736 domain-containing protein n=1 Tax=Caulobacter sp. SSI4214 TaxID=2575739 RepID=UPI0014397627|nr:DUF736 domain-containing protein [Caulobacter sp. SSI4214]